MEIFYVETRIVFSSHEKDFGFNYETVKYAEELYLLPVDLINPIVA